MILRMTGVSLLAGAIAVSAGFASVARAADVDVKAMKITDNRSRQLIETERSKKFGSFPGTTDIELVLQGAKVAEATHWGHVNVTQAKDDKGNDVKLAAKNFSYPGFKDYSELNRKHMWFFEKNPPKDSIKVTIKIAQPARAASKLTIVEGSLKLKSATFADVNVAGLAGLVGKAVDDPLLKKAGATVTIKKVDAKTRQLQFVTNDPDKRIEGYSLVDPGGKKLSQGHSAFGFGNSKTVTLSCTGLPANATLQLKIATATKETTVPFTLTNLPLP